MRNPLTWNGLHVLVFASWLAFCVSIGIDVATAGAESAHLDKRRGGDLEQRTELEQQRYNLLKEVDDLAQRQRIDAALARLRVPLRIEPALAVNHDRDLTQGDSTR
ncbi:MAG: hypothetical protein ACOCYP_02510 [Planctomycetota bacterium]